MDVVLKDREIAEAVLHSLIVRGLLDRDEEYQVWLNSTKTGSGEAAVTTFEVVVRPQTEEPR